MGWLPPKSGDAEVDQTMAVIEAEYGPEAASGEPPKGGWITTPAQGGWLPATPQATKPSTPPEETGVSGAVSAIPYGGHLKGSLLDKALSAGAETVGDIFETWDKYITTPYLEKSFKEDPRKTIRERGIEKGIKPLQPGMTTEEVGESLLQRGKEFGVDIIADPLTALGANPLFRGSRFGVVPAPKDLTPRSEPIPFSYTPELQGGGVSKDIPILSGPVAGKPFEPGLPILQGPEKPLPGFETAIPGALPQRLGEEAESVLTTPESMSPLGHGPFAGSPLGDVQVRRLQAQVPDPLAIEPKFHPELLQGRKGKPTVPGVSKYEEITRLPKVVTPKTKLTPEQIAEFEIEWKRGRDERFKDLLSKLDTQKSTLVVGPIEKYFGKDVKLPEEKWRSPNTLTDLMAPVHDALNTTGEYGRAVSWTDKAYINAVAEQLTYRDMFKLDDMFERWFGLAPIWKRNVPWRLPDTTTFYNISEDQIRQLVNYLYTANGRYGKVLYPKDPKVKGFADEFIKYDIAHSQAHPGVRQAHVLQADGTTVPVGEQSGYYPHNPIDPELQDGLNGRAFEMALKQRQKVEPTLTAAEFRSRIQKYNREYPRYAGLEMQRLLDATDGATKEPYTVLKSLGYGVDPLRDFTMRWAGMYKRGQQILAEPDMKKLLNTMREGAEETSRADVEWVDMVAKQIMGLDREFPDRVFSDVVTKVNNLGNIMMLQRSGIQQLQQLTYTVGRYGVDNTLKALFRTNPNFQREVMEKSAANFATYLQLLQPNPDALGRALQRELQVNLMSKTDGSLRLFAAKAADNFLLQQVKRFANDVTNPAFVGYLREGGFSPAQITEIQKGGLTLEHRLQWAKLGSDMTQGRAGALGVPGWVARWRNRGGAEGQAARLFFNLRTFQLANMGEARRLTSEALRQGLPKSVVTGRILRLVGAGLITGEIANDLSYLFLYGESPFTDARTPKWMRERFGDDWARIIQDTVGGLGLFQAVLAMSLIQGTNEAMSGLFVPSAMSKGFDLVSAVWKAIEQGDLDAINRFILRSTAGTEAPLGKRPEREGMIPKPPGVGLNQ